MGALTPGINPIINAWNKVGAGISFSAFTSGLATLSIPLFSLPAGGIITNVKIKHSVAFAGGTVASALISVGIAGNLERYATAFNVFQAPGAAVLELSSGAWCESQSAATQVLVTCTVTGDILSSLVAGTVDIWALVSTAA